MSFFENEVINLELLTAFGWLSIMLLIGVFCRAKIKLFRHILMPASVIAGTLGFLLINAGVLSSDYSSVYNDMAAHLFTLSFISIGLTSLDEQQGESKAKRILKGSITIGAIWVFLWSITPLMGYLI